MQPYPVVGGGSDGACEHVAMLQSTVETPVYVNGSFCVGRKPATHGERFVIFHWPCVKQRHAAGPFVAFGSGSTSPSHAPHCQVFSLFCWQVVVPSLH